jgi:AraC-like DNA-binding protein/mannose-6-phosphate isomerase-like protein (cupin superfamily)
MPTPRSRPIGPLTPHLYVPTAQRPLRAKQHRMATDTRVVPHHHPWGQLALSPSGVVRLTVENGTYLVPPSRALWVPPGVEHALTVVEDSDLRTLYIHQPPGRCGPEVPRSQEAAWRQCRVLEVSDLLRALVLEMNVQPDGTDPPLTADELQREKRLTALVLDELRRARPVRLGVDMPADKRLRSLCEAVLDNPTRHATLAGWAHDSGASERTVARLFRQQLGTTFQQWRQQVLLAKALSLAARKLPMSAIASELGYASPSAFTAMVRRSMGAPPSRFFA